MKNKKFIPAQLLSEEGRNLPAVPWNEYPRPSLVRDSFLCLNGEWKMTDTFGEVHKILVPFPPESILSGVNKRMGARPHLVYEKQFTLPDNFSSGRLILHFGAVDQIAHVSLNGWYLGSHAGGYTHFAFDVTGMAKKENILTVEVENSHDPFLFPYGKQREKRGGMWYTPVSGIWQTVWMESVPEKYVTHVETEICDGSVTVRAHGVEDGEVIIFAPEGETRVPLVNGIAKAKLENPRLWSMDDPYLYRFTLTAGKDRVSSYFAVRTVSCENVNGTPRICLNGKPCFLHGLLDQGYFSDGIYTPASPKCLENDVLAAKALGFNMLRKHIKQEPELFYYYCDLHGMAVVQDMVNNGKYSFLRDTALPTLGLRRKNDRRTHRKADRREAFKHSMIATVRNLKKHPCILGWTVFNEGWGQFTSDKMYDILRSEDPTRFIDAASGWFYPQKSDLVSPHVYFKPLKLKGDGIHPLFLSEFGGYSFKPQGHVYNTEKTYGYKYFDDRDEFERAFLSLYREQVIPALKDGLCGAVYTQLSDVEDETNGLLSYDRCITKVTPEKMRAMADELFCEFEKEL